jgi:hypothetical protein
MGLLSVSRTFFEKHSQTLCASRDFLSSIKKLLDCHYLSDEMREEPKTWQQRVEFQLNFKSFSRVYSFLRLTNRQHNVEFKYRFIDWHLEWPAPVANVQKIAFKVERKCREWKNFAKMLNGSNCLEAA